MPNSRRKGKRGELEAAHYLSDLLNLRARRGQQYSGLEAADVVGVPGVHVEVKRCERLSLYRAIDQAQNDAGPDEVAIVLHRRNRKPWLVIFEADDLIGLTTNIAQLGRHLNNKQGES